LSTYRESSIDKNLFFSSVCDRDIGFFARSPEGLTSLDSLTNILFMHSLVNQSLRERGARVTTTIYAPARVYTHAEGGDGEERRGRNEIKRENEKKRETNENKGDDRRTRFAALASLTTA